MSHRARRLLCRTFSFILALGLLTTLVGCQTTTAPTVASPAADVPMISTPEWAFDRPELSVLRASERKVFAHYFPTFPLSIDNRPAEEDYYTCGFLSTDGENGKHRSYGGYLRQRPMPRPPRTEPNFKLEDLKHEVALASYAGLDGFCYNMLGVGEGSRYWVALLRLLEAAESVDPSFKIMLMPDMMAQFRSNPELLVPAVLEIADHPSLYRLDDGRLVIAPYMANMQTPDWWREQLAMLEAEGVRVAFVPLFQAWWKYTDDYASLAYGLSDWGAGTADELVAGGRTLSPQNAHALGKLWMAPIRPQDFRPKSRHAMEAHNTRIFRRMWQIALDGDAEWVQLITWNDYSEASEIAPSTGTQYAFYDLTAYYTTWFKMGAPPPIRRDALYYTYRIQHTDAKPDPELQTKAFSVKGERAYNEVELLALLTAPGTLEIQIGGTTESREVGEGMQIMRVPLVSGTPQFRLVRNGAVVHQVTGHRAIDASSQVGIQDLLYYAGGGTTHGR